MIPTYRPKMEYLRQTIESVLKQNISSEQMQIEVVDDCSPDVAVEDMVKVIAGQRVAFSKTETNLGLAGCWNTCVERSIGQWVHILHQDDVVLPRFYEILRPGCESETIPGLIYCRSAFMDGEGHWLGLSEVDARARGLLDRPLQYLAGKQRIQTPAVVVRRSIYESQGGFRSDLTFTLDWEMWCRIAKDYPVWYEPTLLACYRIHTSAETSRLRLKAGDIDDVRRCIKMVSDYLPEKKMAARIRRLALDYYAIQALQNGWELLLRRNFVSGFRQIRGGFKCGVSPKILWRAVILGMKTLRLAVTGMASKVRCVFNS
jgi:glycosyltransferase involved in cell wall biosynthesis